MSPVESTVPGRPGLERADGTRPQGVGAGGVRSLGSDGRPSPWLPPVVWLFGWISFLTDTASEAIYPLLPLFLTQVLGARPIALGVVEGAAEGASSALKVASGWLSDRLRRRRAFVIGGYALSSFVRPLIGLAGSWTHVFALRLADRVGKGVRGAPRDAMLAAIAGPQIRGRVFGLHRAMDHAGAVAGPLLASAFLLATAGPGATDPPYRTLFLLTLLPGLAVVALASRIPHETCSSPAGPELSPRRARPVPGAGPTTATAAARLASGVDRSDAHVARSPGSQASGTARVAADAEAASAPGARVPGGGGPPGLPEWRLLPPALRRLMLVLLVFALGNSTDAYLLLRLSGLGVSATAIPLLWAALHVVKAGTSVGGGLLADRVGRRPVIVAGWVVYMLVYAGFATFSSREAIVGLFLFYGLSFGLTEGVEKAFIADLSPSQMQGTAFGLYHGMSGVGALCASLAFGAMWEWRGPAAAFGMGASLAAAAAVLLFSVPVPVPSRRA